ncbi:MAG: glycoside hydrolase family 92 protein, partial [Bacteroidetes bacterium]|nr:glycoside hydrolase family 92 protein [Bacteroidota bacterium]
EKAREIMKDLYKDNTEEGMSGNDDCGQMSAWYIFSSLGFYPVFPANGAYVFGSPLFDKATVKVGTNKIFTVEVENNSPDNIYIQRVELNGKPYTKTYIMHSDIMKGGTLKFLMGNKPDMSYGKEVADSPKSVY